MKNQTGKAIRLARGMTLVELMISIAIIGILSIGATNLIVAGLKTDRLLLDSDRQVSEMELSIRRMIHNIRTGGTITLSGTTGMTIVSQADPTNNGQTYVITYTYDSNAKTLSESSTQFGATPPVNIIAYNVTAFSVTTASTSPLALGIDMTISVSNTSPPTRRVFQILNRNS